MPSRWPACSLQSPEGNTRALAGVYPYYPDLNRKRAMPYGESEHMKASDTVTIPSGTITDYNVHMDLNRNLRITEECKKHDTRQENSHLTYTWLQLAGGLFSCHVSTEPIKREEDSTVPDPFHSLVDRSNACCFFLGLRLRAPVPAAKRGWHPTGSPDVLCLLRRPSGAAVPLRLGGSSLLVCGVPRGRELAHQLVLRTGSHPLHLDLEKKKPWQIHQYGQWVFYKHGHGQMVPPQRKGKDIPASQAYTAKPDQNNSSCTGKNSSK